MKPDRSAERVNPDKNGRMVTYRPIAIGDRARLKHFHETLSPETVRQRFSSPVPLLTRIDDRRLDERCAIDGTRHFAIVAMCDDEILGIARFIAADAHGGEIAFVVRDQDQSKRIGTALMRELLSWIERTFGKTRPEFEVRAQVRATNEHMKALLRLFDFTISADPGDYTVINATRTFAP